MEKLLQMSVPDPMGHDHSSLLQVLSIRIVRKTPFCNKKTLQPEEIK
jgi:hypothetical protein